MNLSLSVDTKTFEKILSEIWRIIWCKKSLAVSEHFLKRFGKFRKSTSDEWLNTIYRGSLLFGIFMTK